MLRRLCAAERNCEMKETQALGSQPISKLLLKFSVPCVTGLLIGALYNIVDQIFIGNSSLGYLGNAATGISFPIICIANAFAWCIGDGAASYLSICAGRHDTESAHKCVGNGLTAAAIISILLAIIGWVFCEPLMVLFGASDATLTLACDYFRIVVAFFPAYLMLNVMNGIIRADGSPSYSMASMLSGAIINIILDPICIFVLDWGIQGAAIATVVGQVISFIICALYFRKPKSFSLKKSSFRLHLPMLRNLVMLGGSTFIIQISLVVMTLLSNVMLFQYGALSVYGSDIPISVFSIQTKVYTIVNNIAVGIALGGQPILGYNYGAKRMDRVRECYRKILLSSLTVGVVATAVFLFAPKLVIGIFGKQNDLYMDFAVKSFRIFLSLCFVTTFIKISSIFFQSIGKPTQSMLASLVRDLFCFVSFTILLCNLMERSQPGTGIYGILWASPLSDLIAGTVIAILTVRFFKTLDTAPAASKTADIAASRPGTIITIDRQHGTGGRQIGEMLAQTLQVPIYRKDLPLIAAKESGLSEEFLSGDYDEPSEMLREGYLATPVGQQSMIAQEKALCKIAEQGACVIVGQAANFILRNHPNVVRVFLYAPEEFRINTLQQKHSVSAQQAQQMLTVSDTSRASHYRHVTGSEWEHYKNYDLCLDASVGKEVIAKIIETYVRGV